MSFRLRHYFRHFIAAAMLLLLSFWLLSLLRQLMDAGD